MNTIQFNPTATKPLYQLAKLLTGGWVLSVNQPYVYDDNDYHVSVLINKEWDGESWYRLTPQISEMGSSYPIVSFQQYLDWHMNMCENVDDVAQQLQNDIEYKQTHYVLETDFSSIHYDHLRNMNAIARNAIAHFMSIINLGLISLHN